MVKKLIINADDFGATEGISKGIIDCHTNGVLTSTTLLVNTPFTEFSLKEAEKCPDLGVGIHLNVTFGRPLVGGAKSFTDSEGNFLPVTHYPDRHVEVDPEELFIEWQAQMEKFIHLAGKLPTHIDSHHHAHGSLKHRDVVVKLARAYDLPVRPIAMIPDDYERITFMGDFYGEDVTVRLITDALTADVDIMEIMCHPAYLDQQTYEISSYRLPRMKEMEILRSHELRKFIEEHGIQLITYGDLRKRSL